MIVLEKAFVVSGSVEVRTDIKVDLVALIRKYPQEYANVKMDGYQRWERPIVFLDEHLRDMADAPHYGVDVKAGWDDMDIDLPSWSENKFRDLCQICPEAAPERLVEATFGPHRADRDADAIGPFDAMPRLRACVASPPVRIGAGSTRRGDVRMIVLGLILFVFAGWGLAACLCRAAAFDPPDYEQRSHVEVLRFVDVVTLMDGDA